MRRYRCVKSWSNWTFGKGRTLHSGFGGKICSFRGQRNKAVDNNDTFFIRIRSSELEIGASRVGKLEKNRCGKKRFENNLPVIRNKQTEPESCRTVQFWKQWNKRINMGPSKRELKMPGRITLSLGPLKKCWGLHRTVTEAELRIRGGKGLFDKLVKQVYKMIQILDVKKHVSWFFNALID